MLIDHDHTHQWDRLGVNDSRDGFVIVYQCADCDAWTSRTLDETARVPFRRGDLDDGE